MFAADAARVGPARVRHKDLPKAEIVLPPGTEVIGVVKALPWAQPKAGQSDVVRVTSAGGADGAAPIVFAMYVEAVEMDSFPAHGNLDDLMEVDKRRISAHQHAAPDQRGHVAQDHPELVNADGCSRRAHGSAFYPTITAATEPAPGL